MPRKKRFPGGPDPCRGVLGPRDWALDFSAVNDDNGKTMWNIHPKTLVVDPNGESKPVQYKHCGGIFCL